MDGQRLTYLFTLGAAATVNPCGFALLPAYLSFYLGTAEDPRPHDDPDGDPATARPPLPAPLRAVKVGAAMTAGFLVVFGTIGTVWSSISSVVGAHQAWISVVIGALLILLGVAMVAGFQPTLALPKLAVGKGDVQVRSMFLFGMSYAVASLSCTIPLLIGPMALAFDESFLDGIVGFAAYGLGMGALVTVLTLAVAAARTGLVTALRRAVPWMTRVSGVLMVGGGVLVAYYGWASTQPTSSGVERWLYDVQNTVVRWITDVGALRVGLMCAAVIAGAVSIGVVLRRTARP